LEIELAKLHLRAKQAEFRLLITRQMSQASQMIDAATSEQVRKAKRKIRLTGPTDRTVEQAQRDLNAYWQLTKVDTRF
jgi:hypothetical protein